MDERAMKLFDALELCRTRGAMWFAGHWKASAVLNGRRKTAVVDAYLSEDKVSAGRQLVYPDPVEPTIKFQSICDEYNTLPQEVDSMDGRINGGTSDVECGNRKTSTVSSANCNASDQGCSLENDTGQRSQIRQVRRLNVSLTSPFVP